MRLYTIEEPHKTVFSVDFDADQETEGYDDTKTSFHEPDVTNDMVIDLKWMFNLLHKSLPEDLDDPGDEHTSSGEKFFEERLKPFFGAVLDKHGKYEDSGEHAEQVVMDSMIFDLQEQIACME
jgi:hypothetical protein